MINENFSAEMAAALTKLTHNNSMLNVLQLIETTAKKGEWNVVVNSHTGPINIRKLEELGYSVTLIPPEPNNPLKGGVYISW